MFFKSCIAPCSAMNSGCLLNGLKTFSSWFVSIYTHLLATMNSKFFITNLAFTSFIQISCSLCRQRVGIYVNKPLTSSHWPLIIGSNLKNLKHIEFRPNLQYDYQKSILVINDSKATNIIFTWELLFVFVQMAELLKVIYVGEHSIRYSGGNSVLKACSKYNVLQVLLEQ